MGRLKWLVVICSLSGCAAASTVSAIPVGLVEGAVEFFRGQQESLPVNMKISLASVQAGLRSMALDVDVLEPVQGGYAITFGNKTLDGTLNLKRQTPRLTTFSVSVRRGLVSQKSVETAIIKAIRITTEKADAGRRFNFQDYHHIHIRPSIRAKRIGWFRPGATLEAERSKREGWLRIKLPSGKRGYLKGSLPRKRG